MSNQTIELKELIIQEATAQELAGELSDENLDRTETSVFGCACNGGYGCVP